MTNFANYIKEYIKRCQKGDEQACGTDINIPPDYTGLPNLFNFVDQSYSFGEDDYQKYLEIPNIRLFQLAKGSNPTYRID